jgi:hypothetical protein
MPWFETGSSYSTAMSLERGNRDSGTRIDR